VPIILIASKEGVTDAGEYVFQHFLTPAQQIEALTQYALDTMNITIFPSFIRMMITEKKWLASSGVTCKKEAERSRRLFYTTRHKRILQNRSKNLRRKNRCGRKIFRREGRRQKQMVCGL